MRGKHCFSRIMLEAPWQFPGLIQPLPAYHFILPAALRVLVSSLLSQSDGDSQESLLSLSVCQSERMYTICDRVRQRWSQHSLCPLRAMQLQALLCALRYARSARALSDAIIRACGRPFRVVHIYPVVVVQIVPQLEALGLCHDCTLQYTLRSFAASQLSAWLRK